MYDFTTLCFPLKYGQKAMIYRSNTKIDLLFQADMPAPTGGSKISSQLTAKLAKLICPRGGLQFGKYAVLDEQVPWNDPGVCCLLRQYDFL